MPRPKKELGRPLERKYPPRLDATAEEMVQAMFSLPADHEWQYENGAPTTYHCQECGEAVYFPDTLYRDGRCSDCHTAVTA